jgi:hypothetical protein
LETGGAFVEKPRPPHTAPQSVEEAIPARHADDPEATAHALTAVRDFVALAEHKERETGRVCTVVVDCRGCLLAETGSCTPLAARPGIQTAARRTGSDSHRSA